MCLFQADCWNARVSNEFKMHLVPSSFFLLFLLQGVLLPFSFPQHKETVLKEINLVTLTLRTSFLLLCGSSFSRHVVLTVPQAARCSVHARVIGQTAGVQISLLQKFEPCDLPPPCLSFSVAFPHL